MNDRGRSGRADATYEVLFVQLDDARGEGHDHVTFVDTQDPTGIHMRWTSVDVIAAIRDGAKFVLAEDGTKRRTLLQPAVCPECPLVTLEIEPPARRPIGAD